MNPAILLSAHPILDLIVDNEIQLLIGETIMLCQYTINLIDNGLRELWIELIVHDRARRLIDIGALPGIIHIVTHKAVAYTRQQSTPLLCKLMEIDRKAANLSFVQVIAVREQQPVPEEQG